MKTKTTLFPILVIALLCSNLFGSNVISTRKASVAGLPNPALVGIEAFRVVVMYHNAALGRDDWIFTQLGATAEQRLAESEPRIAAMIERGYAARYLNIPILRINIDKLVLEPTRPPAFYVQTSFAADITFVRNPSVFFRLDLWTRADTIQAESLQAEFTAVTSLVNKHIEEFVSDFTQANSLIILRPDVNDFNNIPAQTAQQTPAQIPKEKPKTPVEKDKVEYKYIASKNSSIFHKADCSWVNRILPKNRIEYETREQAINAGKKPCKKCKP